MVAVEGVGPITMTKEGGHEVLILLNDLLLWRGLRVPIYINSACCGYYRKLIFKHA